MLLKECLKIHRLNRLGEMQRRGAEKLGDAPLSLGCKSKMRVR